VDLALQLGIVANPGARRHRDEDQRDVAVRARIAFQEALEAQDPLQQALGVVKPVHAQDESMVLAEAAAQPRSPIAYPRTLSEFFEIVARDPKRKGADLDGPAAKLDCVALEVDLRSQDSLAGALEVNHIGRRMEPDQIAAQHPREQLATPREHAEQFLR